MNNCSPWIHEIYQGIFEICTDLGILVVNAKYAQKYTVAYTRFFAQCTHPYISSSSNVGWSLSTSARPLASWSLNRLAPRSSFFSLHHFSPSQSSHMASSLRPHNHNLSSDSVVFCLSTCAAQISITNNTNTPCVHCLYT